MGVAGGSIRQDVDGTHAFGSPDGPEVVGMAVSTPDGPSRDETFHLLRNERRRRLLRFLREADPPAAIGDLATRVAAVENDTTPRLVTSDQRKRVYTALQQVHLPALDEADVVDFDRDRGLVRPTEHTEDVTVYMEVVPGGHFPWREYYLALGAVETALATALWADVTPLTPLPDPAWTALVAVVLVVSATTQILVERSGIAGGEVQ